jgi:hypothetical protein
MNALDLADDLEGWCDTPLSIKHKDNVFKEHADMLRQQHAEIEALKQIIDANNLSQNIGQFVKPANKPVAWMVERTTGTKGYGDTPYVTLLDATKSTYWIENEIPEGYTVIPLYTHPVKEQDESFDRTASHMAGEYVSYQKELTNEEIIATVKDHFIGAIKVGIVLTNDNVLEFARAILRKAQEKTIQSVMSEHCTCYKLGYSQLNNYEKVKK